MDVCIHESAFAKRSPGGYGVLRVALVVSSTTLWRPARSSWKDSSIPPLTTSVAPSYGARPPQARRQRHEITRRVWLHRGKSSCAVVDCWHFGAGVPTGPNGWGGPCQAPPSRYVVTGQACYHMRQLKTTTVPLGGPRMQARIIALQKQQQSLGDQPRTNEAGEQTLPERASAEQAHQLYHKQVSVEEAEAASQASDSNGLFVITSNSSKKGTAREEL